MTANDQDLDRSLARLFAEQSADADRHLDPEELFAYLAGELSESAVEHLRQHLEGCRECVDLLLELELLAAPDAPPTDGVADLGLAATRRVISEHFAGERSAANDERVRRSRRLRLVPGRWGGIVQAAAAVFLVTTLGLSVRVAQLQRTTAELRHDLEQPRLNVSVFYADATRSGGVVVDELPPDNDFFLLMLIPTERRVFASYEVEIRGADQRPIWSGKGLEMSAGGTLRLGLSRRFLPPGDYRVRLYGLAGQDRVQIEEYALEIR